MVFLDRGPDAGSSVGLPDKGLEETFPGHLGPRPGDFHLLDVRWRRLPITVDRLLNSGYLIIIAQKRA